MENKSNCDLVGQSLIKSRERVSRHGEVFTALREVNAMLDLVKSETERIESRFLELACGNGNFLAEILRRKLNILSTHFSRSRIDYEFNAIVAVGSIYGIEIQIDNVDECRERLLGIFREEYMRLFKKSASVEFLKSIKYIIDTNILWGDALTLKTPNGDKPITFAEWSAVTAGNIKRRDFTLDNLLQNQPIEEPNLFSDLGDEAFIPTPIREYPITHYLKLSNHEYTNK